MTQKSENKKIKWVALVNGDTLLNEFDKQIRKSKKMGHAG